MSVELILRMNTLREEAKDGFSKPIGGLEGYHAGSQAPTQPDIVSKCTL